MLLKNTAPFRRGSVGVFQKKSFYKWGCRPQKNIEVIARQIAMECKGLSLAVNLVGAIMACEKTEEDWSQALTPMRNTDHNFRNIDTI
jgi:hypothetical protein